MFRLVINAFPKINWTVNRLCELNRHCHVIKCDTLRWKQCFSNSLLIPKSGIHTSPYSFVKQFAETENKYAYSVLKKSEAYRETLASENFIYEFTISDQEFDNLCSADWSNESAESIFLGFKKLSCYSSENPQTISDEKFRGIVTALVKKCPQLSDEDLMGILACLRNWAPTSSVQSSNFIELWEAVDEQCVSRISSWDRNKVLLVADHWYLLHLTTFCKFMWCAITRLTRRPENLTPEQLVQCIFYINARRNFPENVSVYDIEYSLEKFHDRLSVEEVAILAMGFFKSKTSIKSQSLVMGIMRQVMDHIDTIHEIALSAISKIIRSSLQPTNGDMLIAFLGKVSTQIDRLSLLSCTHISLIGTNIQVFHKETIDKIVDKYYNEINSCRLKDLERVSFALSLFNYKHHKVPSIYDLLAEQICSSKRVKEIETYPKCVPCCLSYLSQNGIYVEQEISKVLRKEYIVNVYGKNKYKIGREILNLDASVELECPGYSGNRLDPKTRNFLSRIYTDKIWQYEDLLNRNLNAANKMLLEVYSTTVAILGGRKKVHLGHLIPHRERADIIYGLQDDGSAVDIPSAFRTLSIGLCKKTPDIPNTKWYCIIAGGWNMYVRNTNEPVGSLVSKMRQLQILNYNVILIPWFEWRILSAEDQQNYLHKKMYGDVRSKAKLVSQ